MAIRLAALWPRTRLLTIEMMLVPLPATPRMPAAPAALLLPPCTWMPPALGKLVTVFPEIVALVRLETVVAEPRIWRLMP